MTTNPILKQLISEIASKAAVGRTNLSWSALNEGKRKSVKEAAPKDPIESDIPADTEDAQPEVAPQEKPVAPKSQKSSDVGGAAPTPAPTPKKPDAQSPDVAMDAKADAEKAEAEVEKAKAEKDQAEQELEDQSYIKLNSPSGLSFLLGKMITSAFQSNSIDALAGEFVEKLAITTPEDIQQFETDMTPYKNIPGMVEFIDSMKSLSSQKQAPSND